MVVVHLLNLGSLQVEQLSLVKTISLGFFVFAGIRTKLKNLYTRLIKNQIDNFGLVGYKAYASEIKNENGTEFVFYGIERNIDEIKSFEGADVLWIEEAHNLTEEQWKIL